MAFLTFTHVAFLLLAASFPSALAATECGGRVLSLLPCIPFTQSAVPDPHSACCDGLADVYRDSPQCLCQLLNQSASSLTINRTRALELPRLCRVALASPVEDQCPGLALPPLVSSRQNLSSDSPMESHPIQGLFGTNGGIKASARAAVPILMTSITTIAWLGANSGLP